MTKKLSLMCLMLMCVVPSIATGFANLDSPEAVAGLVAAEFLSEGADNVSVYVSESIMPAGTGIETWRTRVTVLDTARWFVFIDDQPGANWEHACRYVFIDPVDGSYEVVDHTQPPELLPRMKCLIGSRIGEFAPAPPVAPLKTIRRSASRNPDNLYAVLISGGASQYSNYPRYWNDISEIYTTLVDVYDYPDDHIYALISDGLNPAADRSDGTNSNPDLDGDGDDDITHSCTVANLTTVFGALDGILTAQDTLLVYATDHGSSNGGWSTSLNLWGEEITDAAFAALVDPIECGDEIYVFEQCYSGGFLDNLAGTGNRVVMSAARHDESSWAMGPDYIYDEFVYYWTAAVRWMEPDGTPVDADSNNDDIVTMDEAFLYAETHDTADESPQYQEEPAGYGATVSLAGSGPTSAGYVTFFKDNVNCDDTVLIEVGDVDLMGAGCASVVLVSDTEPAGETITLNELNTPSGIFQGTIETASGAPGVDGILQVSHGDEVTVTYHDDDNGSGQAVDVADEAGVDCVAPIIGGVSVVWKTHDKARITWTTNEAASSRVYVGSTLPPTQLWEDDDLVTVHLLDLDDLEPCTAYAFYVESVDEAGNLAMDDNYGSYYSFVTNQVVVCLEEHMDTNP
ncbi:hypothetical protein JW905_16530, partial [bacterium]|nr:hypothetical protein [candidate division CSSED10-310 bacterium]